MAMIVFLGAALVRELPQEESKDYLKYCGGDYRSLAKFLTDPLYKNGRAIVRITVGLKDACYYLTFKNYFLYDRMIPETKICNEYISLKYLFKEEYGEKTEFQKTADGM